MKKQFKKLLCASLSIAMIAGSIVLPTSAGAEDYTPIFDGDTVLNEWKFDFGAADVAAEEGWIRVDPSVNFIDNNKEYGFIGNNDVDWELPTGRWDGFEQQQGQIIELAAGGGEGAKDGIGVVGAGGTEEQGGVGNDLFGNQADKYYPVRFTMGAKDDAYYRVRATVTTFDQNKPAVASLYTERKHPLYTEKTIAAGETVVTEWTVRPTPIYYKGPKIAYADEMVNIALLGENTALVSIEIQQVETAPVLWVLGDSTTTDGPGSLPFWPLQNYTGDGSGITKYLPANIAMVNEGEGGLNSTDKEHFNEADKRIKAGDFMWVEYGHNDSNVDSYNSQLHRYYDSCKGAKGGEATLILVGPLDRCQRSQYNSATNTWTSTLKGYSDAAKAYVDDKLKANANDKIAFVDLNQPTLDWFASVTAGATVGGAEVKNNVKLIDYYFRIARGADAPDTTHPNDLGGENIAYLFFKTGDDTTYPALAPLLKRYKDGKAEPPTAISQAIMDLGFAANDAWPAYQPPVEYDYPTVVKDVVLNDNNEFVSMEAQIQAGFDNYASGVIEILDADGEVKGKYITYNHLDNTNAQGTYTLYFVNPDGDDDYIIPALEEDQTYRAYIWSRTIGAISEVAHTIMSEEDGGEQLSAIYTPTDIEVYLLPGSSGGIEDFVYRGSTNLTDNSNWIWGGSNSGTFTLGADGDRTYTTVKAGGSGNSWTLRRALENLPDGTGYEGKYMVDVEINYSSGTDASFVLSSGASNSSPFISGDTFTMFTIGNGGTVSIGGTVAGTLPAESWSNIRYILDMDKAVASLSVAGGEPREVALPAYDTFDFPTTSYKHFFITGPQNAAFDFKMSNLTVAKLKSDVLPDKTLKAAASHDDRGEVEITAILPEEPEPTAEPTVAPTVGATTEPAVEPTVGATTEPAVEPTVAPTEAPETDAEEGASLMSVDDANLSLSYKDGKTVVKADAATTVTLIEAVYENNALVSVKLTPIEFTEAGEKEFEAMAGSKLMLWDSFDGVEPTTETVSVPTTAPTVEPTAEPTVAPTPTPAPTPMPAGEFKELTAPMNTTVVAKATAYEGYVFMGWLDADKGNVVSMDDEYTFRLHDDRSLVAKFVVEPNVEDVTNYSIVAADSSIKYAVGAKTTMSIVNAVDAAGTPVSKAKNTDATWSCAVDGVDVSADGVVTIGDAFSMGDALTKDVTIKASLNGIERTYAITIYAYEYFENMNEESTNFDGTFMTIAGRTSIAFPAGGGSKTYKMTEPVTIDKKTTVYYDHAWSGANTCGQERTLNFLNSDGATIFSIVYSWGDMIKPAITGAVKQNTWTTVSAVIDPDTNTVTVTANGATATTTLSNVKDIAGISFASQNGAPGPEARALAISNLIIAK